MIHRTLVPADDTCDTVPNRLDPLEDMHRAVGGWLGMVDVPEEGATLLVITKCIPRGLRCNRRATHYRVASQRAHTDAHGWSEMSSSSVPLMPTAT